MALRRPQPWPVRLTHWLNVPLLLIMVGSGLQILVAYPYQGPRGEIWEWFPFQGVVPPEWMRLGSWLAGARHVHFAFMWLFAANGLVYLAYLALSGEWRRRAFLARRDLASLARTVASYARLRAMPTDGELYNGLQRFAYTGAIALALLELLSGLALYKPVQLHGLTRLFGGYDGARLAHLLGMALLLFFLAGHVTMVLLHPRSLAEMVTGGRPRE